LLHTLGEVTQEAAVSRPPTYQNGDAEIAAPRFSAPILQADVRSEERAGTGGAQKDFKKNS
jgi:hypothetical protein